MAFYGLKKKPTYEEVIDYIENDPDKIKYPNRDAKFLRNSFELSQLDGMGMQIMEQQQLREMKELAKENAIRNLAKNSGMNHAYLREKAKVATRSASVQAMLKPLSSDKGTQESRPTQDAFTQDTKQHESSSSQTQHFDISEGGMPHVEDRSSRILEQENEALLRKHVETQMVALRQQRLLTEQSEHLASLESQAEAMIRRQTQEHTAQLRKERFRTPSPRTRFAMLKHPTTPTGTPNPTKVARTEPDNIPSISPINPVALPPPTTPQIGGSSSSSAPAPKAKAKAKPKAAAKSKGRPPNPPDTGASPDQAPTQGEPPTEPPKGDTRATVQKGVEKIEGKSRTWWSRQNITNIKIQAELRGHRFNDLDTKGGKVKKNGEFLKKKRFSKQDYLDMLFEILKI